MRTTIAARSDPIAPIKAMVVDDRHCWREYGLDRWLLWSSVAILGPWRGNFSPRTQRDTTLLASIKESPRSRRLSVALAARSRLDREFIAPLAARPAVGVKRGG
ncbi:hypothetical protein GCM10022251_64570 [Phytohabitans flavus]